MLRARLRHEIEVARQEARAQGQSRQDQLRRTRITFLPTVAAGFGVASLLGTSLILYVLVRFDAKDQIPVVLAFLSGLFGGILAGFGGGYATAKSRPAEDADRSSKL